MLLRCNTGTLCEKLFVKASGSGWNTKLLPDNYTCSWNCIPIKVPKEELIMKKGVLVVSMLAAVICCITPLLSQGGPGGPGGPGAHGRPLSVMIAVLPPPAVAADGIAKALQLSADRAASLKAALTAGDAAIQPLLKAAGEAAKAAHDALLAADYDADAVADMAAKAQDAEGDVIAASIDAWTQIRLILTADEVAKLQAGPPPCGPPPPGTGPGGSAPAKKGK